MNAKTLFVSDLDGTLLTPDARVSAVSAELLNRAIARGALFTVATARTPATVVPLLKDVMMALPAIVMTGAATWCFETGTYGNLRLLGAEDVSHILSEFRATGVVPFVYAVNRSAVPNLLDVYYDGVISSAADAKFVEQRSRLALKKFHVNAPLPAQSEGNVVLFFASGDAEELCGLATRIKEHTDCSVSTYDDIYNPGTALIEIFSNGVDKAVAIERLKHAVGAERVVVFGDSLNDLPAFGVADTSVAVECAHPDVLKGASLVIGPNTEESVARYILEHTP